MINKLSTQVNKKANREQVDLLRENCVQSSALSELEDRFNMKALMIKDYNFDQDKKHKISKSK